jgi:hypothetical protein
MPIPSPPNTTRLYFINLNGLNLEKKAVKFRDLCEELRKADLHLFSAAKHNLDTNKFAVQQNLQNIARKSFPHQCIQTATSSTLANKFYKPGGTLIMAQGDLVGRIKDRGSDSLGRWSWMTMVGKNQRLVTVISAYQVCIRPTNRTGTTAYHQQESLLRQKGIKKAKPRKYFQHDLDEFICLCKTRQELVILMGDFNEALNERSSMARIASNHGLVDIVFQCNPHLPEPHKYARGSSRIDYVLISPKLVDAVQLCGYQPFQQRIKSDHRGMFIDFDTSMLFGNNTQALGRAVLRNFTAKCPTNNSKFILAKHLHLTNQGFFLQLAQLQSSPKGNHALAERLDTNLRASSEFAGTQLKRFHKPWWSQSITKAGAAVDILQCQLSGFKTNTKVRTVLLERISDPALDLTLPLTQPFCQALLTTKLDALRAMEKKSLELRHDKMAVKANLASDTGNQSTKRHLDRLHSSEAHTAMYRKIKAIRGKYNKSGFASIEVPTSWPLAHSDLDMLHDLPDPKKATDWWTALGTSIDHIGDLILESIWSTNLVKISI